MATFEQFLRKKGVSLKSMKFYVSDIRVFTRWIEKTHGEADISRQAFESYERFLKSSGLPTQSVNRKLSSLRKYNDYLVSENLMKSSPSIKNKSRNASEVFINTRKFTKWFSSISQSYVLIVLFGVILLLGAIILSDHRNSRDINLVPQSGKITLPLVINFSGNTDNLSKLVTADSSLISLESDPIIKESTRIADAGKSEIDENEIDAKIFVPSITNSSIILLTGIGSKSTNLFIKEQGEGYFVASRGNALPENLKFNWLVVANQLPIDIDR